MSGLIMERVVPLSLKFLIFICQTMFFPSTGLLLNGIYVGILSEPFQTGF